MFCGANQVASTRQFVSQTWHLGWFRRKILVVKSNVKKFYPLCSDCIYSTIVLAQELTKELQKKTRAVTLLMEKVVFWRMHSRHLMVDSILMKKKPSLTSLNKEPICCTLLFMRLDTILVWGIPACEMQWCTRLIWDTSLIWSFIVMIFLAFNHFMVSFAI